MIWLNYTYYQANIATIFRDIVLFFDFNTKENDNESGCHYYDFGYSDILTGWLSVDPMADKYPELSPYAYCAWNPVKLVDPDGEEIVMNDDIVIKGTNNSSITFKTDVVDFTINTNTDFGGNHEIAGASNLAVGYEVGVNGTGAAGVGFSYSGYIQNVMFLGGEYAGYWYTYCGGETQMLASPSAEGSLGAQKNWFVAWNDSKDSKNTPSSFTGMYNGVQVGVGLNALIADGNLNASYSQSENETWKILSLGISASVGPQVGFEVSGGVHFGATKLITSEKPTKERNIFDKLFNYIIH